MIINIFRKIFYLLKYNFRHQPATPEQLLDAFRTLDPEGHGYLHRELISTLMTQDGEPFTQDELDEMLEIAIDPHTETVPYEYYINQLMVRSQQFPMQFLIHCMHLNAKKLNFATYFQQMYRLCA